MKLFVTSSTTVSSSATATKIPPPDLSTIAVYDIDPTVLLATRRNDVPFVQLEELRSVERNCSCLSDSTKELLVAQPEGVFGYSVAEQGSAIGIDGGKSFILSVGFNVMLICNEGDDAVVRVYDFKRRYICYEATIIGVAVTHVFQDVSPVNGQLVALLLSDGRIHRVRQLSPDIIVKSFCEAELFGEGLSIAAENEYPLELLRHIYKSQGDWLYQSHKHEEALDKYISAMGDNSFDPSTIIERYMRKDQSRLLVDYLLALTEAGYARKEHIRLLVHRLTENASFTPDLHRLVAWMQSQGNLEEYIPEIRKLVRYLLAADQKEDAKNVAASCHLFEEMIALDLSYSSSFDCRKLASEIVNYSRFVPSDRLQKLLFERAKTIAATSADDLVTLLIMLSTKTANDSGTCCLTVSQCVRILERCEPETRKMYLLNLPFSCTQEIALPLLDALLDQRKRFSHGDGSELDVEKSIIEILQRPMFREEGVALSAISLMRDRNFAKGVPFVVRNAFPESRSLLMHTISLTGDVHELVALARHDSFLSRREFKVLLESAVELVSKGGEAKDGSSVWDPVREIVQIATSRGTLDSSEVVWNQPK